VRNSVPFLELVAIRCYRRKSAHVIGALPGLAPNQVAEHPIHPSGRHMKSTNYLFTLAIVTLFGLGPARAQDSVPQIAAVAVVPAIVEQPAAQEVDYGSDMSFTVTAQGSPLAYQWRKNGRDLADYENVAGAQTAQLFLVGVAGRDAAEYSVVVYNSAGAVTSTVTTLNLKYATVFADDFESGLTKWTAFSAAPGVKEAWERWESQVRETNSVPDYARTLSILNSNGLAPRGTALGMSPERNHTPSGSQSAEVRQLFDKMYHNLGTKLAGPVRATFWIYDDGAPETAWYGELRGYSGAGHGVYYQSDGLRQMFGIGRNDISPTNEAPRERVMGWAEKVDRTKYQGWIGRGLRKGSGWFNLNAPGAPDRSVGWHKFQIVRGNNDSSLEFYVDGVLGRRMNGVHRVLLDCVTIGSEGAGETRGGAWFDDVSVESIPLRYNWQAKDTLGRNLFDWMQLRETGTDPQVAAISQVTTVFAASGPMATTRLGSWQQGDGAVSAQNERGAVEYALQAPAADAYRLEVEAKGVSDMGSPFEAQLILSIDGERLGRFQLPYSTETNGLVHCFTPFLPAGPHTVKVYWDGARDHASLKVVAVRLQATVGPDANSNGIKDWVENRVLSQSGIEIAPQSSLVSPVCIEGRGQYLSMMQCQAGTAPDRMQAVAVEPGAGHRWYANVPLVADAPTRVHLLYQNDSCEEARDITWREFNLLEGNDVTIRQGDALLLTAAPAQATAGEVVITVMGVTNYVTQVGEPVPHRFDQPGSFSVMGTYNGQRAINRSIRVKVVSASLGTPVAAWVGYRRYWDCPDFGKDVVLDVDPRLQIAETPQSVWEAETPAPLPLAANTRRYGLIADAAEPRVVLARLGTNGPVIARMVVEGFRLFTTYDTYMRYVSIYPDGSQLVEGAFVMSPRQVLAEGVTADVRLFSSGAIFEDGTVSKTLTAADFDELGICRVRLVRAASARTSVCHVTRTYQGGMLVGRTSYDVWKNNH
jgi:hypothetical protein